MKKLDPKTYVTLLPWMVEDLKLSGLDLILYAIIYGYSQGSQGVFYGTLTYLATWSNTTERGVIKSLKSLIDKGLIKKEKIKYNKYFYKAIVPDMVNSVHHDGELSSSCMVNSVHHDGELSSPNNKYILKLDNLSKEQKEKSTQKSKSQFNNFAQRDYDLSEIERKMLGGAG